MRGAARIGGKAFRIPSAKEARDGFNPLEALDLVGDLPVAPVLEPINDEWSWSIGADPADPRDCARYPASPYCGEIPLEFGKPFGFTPEIKTNGCETCFYLYPVILWLKVTPQIICKRDPNCDRPKPTLNKDELTKRAPKPFDENVRAGKYKSEECALRERITNYWYNRQNEAAMQALTSPFSGGDNYEFRNLEVKYLYTLNVTAGIGEIVDSVSLELHLGTPIQVYETNQYIYHYVGDLQQRIFFRKSGERRLIGGSGVWEEVGTSVDLKNWKPIPCPDMPRPPKVKPPPPIPNFWPYPFFNDRERQDRKKKRGKGGMCCNDCADSKDNTEKLLREIKEIKKALGTGKLEKALDAAVGIGDSSVTAIVNLLAKRIGVNDYPIEVPASLLSDDHDDKTYKLQSNAEYLFWLTTQIDKLVGEFPIDIEVKDADPIKAGNQPMKIRIPNIAEAIAEIYGLAFKSSVNQEVELNMLLRLALETTHAKNAAIIAQDYSRANAKFLGYQGNTKGRHVDYNFDFTDVNASEKDQNKQLNLESLLKNSKAWIQGWENDDSETAVNFLRKLMFSAGIIKSVFFRDKKQSKAVVENIKAMQQQSKVQDADWAQFLKDINDPNSKYNVGSTEKPDINEDKSK